MPYIKQKNRQQFESAIQDLVPLLETPGDINYVLSSIIWRLWERDKRYTKANTLMGVLSCVKEEFYRRHVVPYENLKQRENGDV